MPQQLEVIQKLSAHRGKVWSAAWHPSGLLLNPKNIKIMHIFFQAKCLQVAAKIRQ
jgi:hypothetical protein